MLLLIYSVELVFLFLFIIYVLFFVVSDAPDLLGLPSTSFLHELCRGASYMITLPKDTPPTLPNIRIPHATILIYHQCKCLL